MQPTADVGAALECSPLAAVARHLFTTRDLELRGNPAEWRAVAAVLGAEPSAIRLVKQVHGAHVAVASDESPWSTPEADIVLTRSTNLVIGVRTADCAPVLLADSAGKAVGAVHAGWRGTLQGALGKAVAAMEREFGSQPRHLVAAIGPCLGVCCGEMGDEVVHAFRAAGHGELALDRWFSIGPGGRWHLDLARANTDQLTGAGVLPANVHAAGLCTRSYPEIFHSYRAEGTSAGRMAAVIRCG